MTATKIGKCSLCRQVVLRHGDGTETVSAGEGTPRRTHTHDKPFTIDVDDDPGDYRYWHDRAPDFVR